MSSADGAKPHTGSRPGRPRSRPGRQGVGSFNTLKGLRRRPVVPSGTDSRATDTRPNETHERNGPRKRGPGAGDRPGLRGPAPSGPNLDADHAAAADARLPTGLTCLRVGTEPRDARRSTHDGGDHVEPSDSPDNPERGREAQGRIAPAGKDQRRPARIARGSEAQKPGRAAHDRTGGPRDEGMVPSPARFANHRTGDPPAMKPAGAAARANGTWARRGRTTSPAPAGGSNPAKGAIGKPQERRRVGTPQHVAVKPAGDRTTTPRGRKSASPQGRGIRRSG